MPKLSHRRALCAGGCGKVLDISSRSLGPGKAICRHCRALEPVGMRRTPIGPPKPCPTCGKTFEPWRKTQTYCSPDCRDQRARSGNKKSSTRRGYGVAHRRERERWAPIVEAGEAVCCLCNQPIKPGSRWHLDHTSDRTGYRGVAHDRCNTRDGARRGNQQRGKKTRWDL